MTKKRAIKTSMTMQPEIKSMCDNILTPSGFHKVTKGTYSTLINRLLSDYLVKHYKANWVDILQAYNTVGAEETEIQNFLESNNN